jgi:peptide/nickel transport system permease protein
LWRSSLLFIGLICLMALFANVIVPYDPTYSYPGMRGEGPSLVTTIAVIGATTWARFARVVWADVMAVRQSDFVTAARAGGVQDGRILFRHVLPNVLGPVIVLATLGVGGIIILESALSFLGLGIQPPTPSWGGTLADGRALIRQFPHIIIFPGIMIFLTVLAFNLLGDGLRAALDPRQRS